MKDANIIQRFENSNLELYSYGQDDEMNRYDMEFEFYKVLSQHRCAIYLKYKGCKHCIFDELWDGYEELKITLLDLEMDDVEKVVRNYIEN